MDDGEVKDGEKKRREAAQHGDDTRLLALVERNKMTENKCAKKDGAPWRK